MGCFLLSIGFLNDVILSRGMKLWNAKFLNQSNLKVVGNPEILFLKQFQNRSGDNLELQSFSKEFVGNRLFKPHDCRILV
jgi:hypothetical protein